MKKTILTICTLMLLAISANAQSYQGKGSNTLYVGIGTGNLNGYGGFGAQANYDYGIHDFISLGAQLNMGYAGGFDMYVGPRADLHILNIFMAKKTVPIDVYAGVSLGLNMYTADQLHARFWGGGYLGIAWQFSERFALRLDTGSSTTIGINFSL